MQLFLSWSGDQSKALASALRDWIPLVIQSVKPWFSPEDIDKGARWMSDLSSQLEQQSVAVICVTRQNTNAPWLLFEAGALSKALESSWVCPVLLGMEPSEIQGPLAQFQATRTNKEDIRRLLDTINKRTQSPLLDQRLDIIFEAFWPQFESQLDAIISSNQAPVQHRPSSDVMAEILERVRSIERQFVERLTDEEQLRRREVANRQKVALDHLTLASMDLDRANAKLSHIYSVRAMLETQLKNMPDEMSEQKLQLLAQRGQVEAELAMLQANQREARKMLAELQNSLNL